MQQTAYAKIVYDRYTRRRGGTGGPRKARTIVALCKDFCRRTIAFLFTQVGVCALLVGYNIVGAFAFRVIEGVMGDDRVEVIAEGARESAVIKLWNVTFQLNVLEEERWRDEVLHILGEYQGTVIPLIRYNGYRGVHPISAWTLPAALMYSLSIYTTIGYGNLTPRTDWGKICTIAYALVGMPLMLLYMSNVGEVLANLSKFLYFKACRCDIGSLGYYRTSSGTIKAVKASQKGSSGSTPLRANSYSSDRTAKGPLVSHTSRNDEEANERGREEEEELPKYTIPISICLLVIASYVLFGGVVFAQWERWSILDGCYFCYVSLSTIGFGDRVPGRIVAGESESSEDVETKQILCSLYLLVGMALVAMCFNLMQEEALENLKIFWRNMGCLRRKNIKKNAKEKELGKDRGRASSLAVTGGKTERDHDIVNTLRYCT